MYQVGVAKADITAYKYGKGMMGYGMHFNVVKGVKTELQARAFIIKDPKSGQKICLVNGELCFYSIAVKAAVVDYLTTNHPDLGYTASNLILSAQHTHSGGGGYSHYLAYNLSIPGFQPKVFDKIVKGTLEAILAAEKNIQPATLHFNTATFAPSEEVAFNRSLTAYNANPEVYPKVPTKERHLAVDRELKLLYFKGLEGDPIGSINWFGVHATSVSNDNKDICFDNKGYAANYMEQHFEGENKQNFVAAFAQELAGDVTPNYKWDFDKYWTRGKYKDDFKSAKHNAKLQYKKALEAQEKAAQSQPLDAGIDGELVYIDFSDIIVDREFVNGKTDKRTASPAIGIQMLQGTVEGPGMTPPVVSTVFGVAGNAITGLVKAYEKTVVKQLFRNRKVKEDIDLKYEMHGKKHIVLEMGAGRILGTGKIKDMVLPTGVDPVVDQLKKLDEAGYSKYTPWMPCILPLQIVIIGELALLCVAAEATTIAGKRLKATALRTLKHRGVRHIILSTYSNGYSGYITTPEEYDLQLYEGSHTIYGKWTLPAYQTKVKQLAIEMLKPKAERNLNYDIQPKIFAENEIWYGEG